MVNSGDGGAGDGDGIYIWAGGAESRGGDDFDDETGDYDANSDTEGGTGGESGCHFLPLIIEILSYENVYNGRSIMTSAITFYYFDDYITNSQTSELSQF